jgi:starch-binding outer membrane protein, SusD/RagB family
MKPTYLICSISLFLLISSCKKFLDQDPLSQATDETTWKTEADANASVAACYSLIRASFNAAITYYTYGDLVSDEFASIVGGDGAYNDVFNGNWGVSIPAANTYDPRLKLRLYTNFYSAIAQSNRCLYFIDQMPVTVFTGETDNAKQATKNKYLGEAYFTRAFTYFYIARVWGDVPLVTTYNTDASTEPQVSRSPQQAVLQQAIADANKAIEYLDWKDNGSSDAAVRADKGAAYALLAHIYAWKGDYDNCNKACDAVIGSNQYKLVPAGNYMDLFKGQSTESIFEIAQNSLVESANAKDVYTITGVTLSPPYLSNGTVQPLWQLDFGQVNRLFPDANDVRFSKAMVLINSGSVKAYESIKWANIQNVNNTPSYQIALNNILVFRLADIQLLKAEALAAKPAPDEAAALVLVNELRVERGTTPIAAASGKVLLKAISNERGRELFLEGHRTFDLIRLERLTGDKEFPTMTHADFIAGRYYWPVDPTLFLTNANLKQTAYWVGKVK